MKKIIFVFFLLTFSLNFSNSDIDIISREVWRCTGSVDKTFKGLAHIKFLNENGNPVILLSILDSRTLLKTGKANVEISQLDYEVKEDEQSIYFVNLNEKTQIFSNYKLFYSFDKKGRPRMDLYSISDNKKLCNLYN